LRVRILPRANSDYGAAVVRVRLQVEEGAVGVGVSIMGNASTLVREVSVYAAPAMEDVYLFLPDVSAAEYLFIRNESADGPSRVLVHSVDVLRSG